MNNIEAITQLGRQTGSKLKIAQHESDIKHDLPYFYISKDRQFKLFNFETHDNADRLPFLCNFLHAHVFKYIPQELSLEGYYNIELHDTYTDKTRQHDYKNCLVWSKAKHDQGVVLIPDLYQLADYGGKLKIQDTQTWDNKLDKIAFFGTTTGDRNPHSNTRINTCFWSKQHAPDICDFYITKIAQIPPQKLFQCFPNFNTIQHSPVEPQHMFKYKYLLDIPGNTCSWDRVPMVLNSKSLLFKMPCHEMCWYYPLLHDNEHYVHVTTDSILTNFKFYQNNKARAQEIIQRANMFVKQFLQPQHAIIYLISLFEEAAHAQSR